MKRLFAGCIAFLFATACHISPGAQSAINAIDAVACQGLIDVFLGAAVAGEVCPEEEAGVSAALKEISAAAPASGAQAVSPGSAGAGLDDKRHWPLQRDGHFAGNIIGKQLRDKVQKRLDAIDAGK